MTRVSVRRRRAFVVLGSAIVLIAAAAVWYVSRSALDPAREQAVRTVVTTYLEQNHWRGSLAGGSSPARWFCEGQVIEADQGSDETAVGFLTACNEFAAVDGELRIASGEVGPRLATVTSPPKPVEVLRVDSPGDGSRYAPWVSANFSWIGTKKLHRLQSSSARDLENATITKARNAFGLPSDAPVHR